MARRTVKADFYFSERHLSLMLFLWEKKGVFYRYAPELDIVGYGKSAKEADESFEYVLSECITYAANEGIIN